MPVLALGYPGLDPQWTLRPTALRARLLAAWARARAPRVPRARCARWPTSPTASAATSSGTTRTSTRRRTAGSRASSAGCRSPSSSRCRAAPRRGTCVAASGLDEIPEDVVASAPRNRPRWTFLAGVGEPLLPAAQPGALVRMARRPGARPARAGGAPGLHAPRRLLRPRRRARRVRAHRRAHCAELPTPGGVRVGGEGLLWKPQHSTRRRVSVASRPTVRCCGCAPTTSSSRSSGWATTTRSGPSTTATASACSPTRARCSAARARTPRTSLQDVFLRAYGALRNDDRPVTLRAWLYRVAHNRCIDHLRRPRPAGGRDLRALAHAGARPARPRRCAARTCAAWCRTSSACPSSSARPCSCASSTGSPTPSWPTPWTRRCRRSSRCSCARGWASSRPARRATPPAWTSAPTSSAAHGRGVRASGRSRRHLRDCDGLPRVPPGPARRRRGPRGARAGRRRAARRRGQAAGHRRRLVGRRGRRRSRSRRHGRRGRRRHGRHGHRDEGRRDRLLRGRRRRRRGRGAPAGRHAGAARPRGPPRPQGGGTPQPPRSRPSRRRSRARSTRCATPTRRAVAAHKARSAPSKVARRQPAAADPGTGSVAAPAAPAAPAGRRRRPRRRRPAAPWRPTRTRCPTGRHRRHRRSLARPTPAAAPEPTTRAGDAPGHRHRARTPRRRVDAGAPIAGATPAG